VLNKLVSVAVSVRDISAVLARIACMSLSSLIVKISLLIVTLVFFYVLLVSSDTLSDELVSRDI